MSEIKVNKLSPSTGTALTLGDNGDTFTIPAGTTLANNGTATGFGSDGVVKYFATAELSASVASTTSTSYISTGATITVPAADVVGLSKIIIFTQGTCRINKNTHAFANFRLQRTAPSAVNYQEGWGGEVTPVDECHEEFGQLHFDTNLGTGDHTYTMFCRKASGTASYAGSIHYRDDGWRLVAIGV